MFKKILLLLAAPILAFAGQIADPVQFMQTVTVDVVADLNKLPNTQESQQLYAIINQKILPHVDIEFMGRWVVGRKAWLESTPEQQKAYLRSFTTLLSRTYSKTLSLQRSEYEVLPPW